MIVVFILIFCWFLVSHGFTSRLCDKYPCHFFFVVNRSTGFRSLSTRQPHSPTSAVMVAFRAGRQTHLYWEFTVGLVLGCRNAARFPAQKWRYFKAIPAVALSTTPLTFPSAGFKELPITTKFEEEEVPGYVSEDFYPVRMGEVFNAQYQVVSKLGHGVGSTVWLARNLKYAL